jgi:DNA-binding NtrC family response regulator
MNEKISILIVDDEKNIRLTLSQALEEIGTTIDTAVNGEEALQKLTGEKYAVMLLDLKMPGMGGMEVLRKVRDIRPDIRVIIITAYGTVDSAVEAMKLGVVDFIQKPFIPNEIRSLVKNVINRETIDEQKADDYTFYLELAKKSINSRHFYTAEKHIKQAIIIDNSRPEAYNILGTLREIDNDINEALKYYRAALSHDATYEPARNNLARREKLSAILEKYKKKSGKEQ